MKTLILWRHAKSRWDIPVPDFERGLTPRGKRAAKEMAGRIVAETDNIDRVLISPARRTRKTAKRLLRKLGDTSIGQKIPELYEADTARLFSVLRCQTDDVRAVVLVGHNPTLEYLVHELTGVEVRMPTAAAAWIDLRCDNWSELSPSGGTLRQLVTPRELLAVEPTPEEPA